MRCIREPGPAGLRERARHRQPARLAVLAGGHLRRGANDVAPTVDAWLERLGLADRAAARLDTVSHGNQQRAQLIAALANDPDLLMLDEPFAAWIR